MICLSCGKEIDGNLKFCINCGANLHSHYCTKCGNVLNTDKKFCEKCGTPNPFYQPPVGTPVSPSNANLSESENNIDATTCVAGITQTSYPVFSEPTVGIEDNKVASESSSQVAETDIEPEPADEVSTDDSVSDDANITEASIPEYEYEYEESKGGIGKIILIACLVLVLGMGTLLLGQRQGWWNVPALSWIGGNSDISSDDLFVEEESNFVDGSQGVLKAFGLKGKVKTLTLTTLDCNFVFAFDLQGNYIKNPDYNGGEISMDSESDGLFANLLIDNWKWKRLDISARFFSRPSYEMTSYDTQNRPIEASILDNDEVVKQHIGITYSGTDSKGNYTLIQFDDAGVEYAIKSINVKIQYWPDDATEKDVPTELTESVAIEIIKKANRKESDALTKEFNRILEMHDAVPIIGYDSPEFGGDGSTYFSEGIGTGTLLSDYDNTDIPNIKVRIDGLRVHDAGDTATVAFYFSDIYDGKAEEFYEKDLSDSEAHFVTAEMNFEDGKWVVNDIGYEVVYVSGLYAHGDSYRNHYNHLDGYINDIRSGKLENEIRETFSEDPKLDEYLKKLEDFKKRFDIK